jgi:iron complex outermembrane recepter protein
MTGSTRRLVLALLASASAMPAFAQETAAAADDASGDIVVTAQRREENLQDVPVSVAAISGERLSLVQSGGADIRALAARVPSLNIESSFGRSFPRFYIRGLGNTDFDLNASQPVSLVYDDVVLENPILKGFPIFDLARVEVLRGPQGTLFGRNTPAGIVKFDTVKPDQEGGSVRVSYGNLGTINAEGGVSIPLGERFSARISGIWQHRDDWVDNLETPGRNDLEGYDDVAARLQLQYQDEALTARLVGQFRNLDGTARVFRANSFAVGSNSLIGLGGPGTKFRRGQVRLDGINFQDMENYNVGLTVDYDFGPVTLTSVTSYWNGNIFTRGDIDGGFGNPFVPSGSRPGFIPFSAQTQDEIPSLDQFTQELRIASNNTDGFGYQAGLFYFNEKLDIRTLDFGTPTDTTPAAIAVQRQDTDAFGIFASVNYKFDNGLRLQAGARWNKDERDFSAGRPVDTRPGFLGFGGPVPTITTDVEADLLTWDVSALYEANDAVNVYARVARGYRAPSIQGRLAFGRTLSIADAEKTMSYEAGIKTVFAGGRARFNLTGFYFNTEDLQLTAVGGASNFTTLLNAAEVEGYGFEAELDVQPVERLRLTAGLSLNQNEIKDPNLFTAGCASGCTVLNTPRAGSPGIFSIDGNRLPQSPKWIANWTASYSVPVGNGEVYAITDWAYRSKIQFFLYRSVEYSSDGLLEGGLRVGYKTGPFDIAAFARNITNEVEAVGGIDFNNLTAFVNEPRTYGVEVGFRF